MPSPRITSSTRRRKNHGTAQNPVSVIERLDQACNAHDLESVMSLFSDDPDGQRLSNQSTFGGLAREPGRDMDIFLVCLRHRRVTWLGPARTTSRRKREERNGRK